jgi:hypothetical protein
VCRLSQQVAAGAEASLVVVLDESVVVVVAAAVVVVAAGVHSSYMLYTARHHILAQRSGKVSGRRMWDMNLESERETLNTYLQVEDDMRCRGTMSQRVSSKASLVFLLQIESGQRSATILPTRRMSTWISRDSSRPIAILQSLRVSELLRTTNALQ